MMRKMKCPYCECVFPISERQERYNSTFTCPECRRANQGSTNVDAEGVLIGKKSA